MNDETIINAAYDTITLPKIDLCEGVLSQIHGQKQQKRHVRVRPIVLLTVLSIFLTAGTAVAAVPLLGKTVLSSWINPDTGEKGSRYTSTIGIMPVSSEFRQHLETAEFEDTDTSRVYRLRFASLSDAEQFYDITFLKNTLLTNNTLEQMDNPDSILVISSELLTNNAREQINEDKAPRVSSLIITRQNNFGGVLSNMSYRVPYGKETMHVSVQTTFFFDGNPQEFAEFYQDSPFSEPSEYISLQNGIEAVIGVMNECPDNVSAVFVWNNLVYTININGTVEQIKTIIDAFEM